MRLRVIGTGSAGNAYLLETEGRNTLLLDAGVSLRDITAALEKPSSLQACLVTHEHMDHAKAAGKLLERGIPVMMSTGTGKALGNTLGPTAFVSVSANLAYRIGDVFTILPFAAEHDAAEPLGYLIRDDQTGEVLLYATDTYYLRNTFQQVHYWLIECNYCTETLDAQFTAGTIPLAMRGRLIHSHMSLDRLLDVFRANDLHRARKIILCHLSDQRSDEKRMVEEVRALTGVDTIAAHAGDVIDLKETPF